MKLRVARIFSNRRMHGEYIIQKRVWFRWKLAFDGPFDTFDEAYDLALLIKRNNKPTIVETTRV